jgi:hypothetical protein
MQFSPGKKSRAEDSIKIDLIEIGPVVSKREHKDGQTFAQKTA